MGDRAFPPPSAAGALRAEAALEQDPFERVPVVALQLDREALHRAARPEPALEVPRERVRVEAALREAFQDDQLAAAAPLLAPHLDRLGALLLRRRRRRRGLGRVGRTGRQRRAGANRRWKLPALGA